MVSQPHDGSENARLAAALAVAWLAALVPIWLPPALPVGNGADPMAARALAARLVPSVASPLAVRFALTAYAAALPASIALLGKRFGRSPWLALLAFPLAFHGDLGRGHLAFALALPPLFAALALLDALCQRPALGRGIGLAACAACADALHPLAGALLVAGAAPILVARCGWLGRPVRLGAGVACAGAAAWLTRAALGGATPAPGASAGDGATSTRLLDLLHDLPQRLLQGWPGASDELVLLALAATWMLVATTARPTLRERPPSLAAGGGGVAPLVAWVPEILFVACAASHFALPAALGGSTGARLAGAHLLAPCALTGALLPRGPIAGRRRLLLLPAALAAAAYPLLLAAHLSARIGASRP